MANSSLKAIFNQIGILGSIQRLVQWDADVMMPIGSSDIRSQQLEFLSTQFYHLLSNPKIEELILKTEAEDLSQIDKANLRLIKRKYYNNKLLDAEFVKSSVKACFNCELNWREAKKNNDFKKFASSFKEVLSFTKEKAARKAEYYNLSLYDALLDEYDEGRKSFELDKVFARLESFLPNFIEKVKEKQKNISVIPFEREFDHRAQKELGLYCAKELGLDFNKAKLDESAHPFSTSFSPHDIRITTRYQKNDFLSGLMGVIHEAGHGLYEQNIPAELALQPVAENCGMTIHESQSLFYEKQIGKSKEFFIWLQDRLNKDFGADKSLSAENLYNMVTKVGASRIRVDADEVTYPAHIILRYKIEKALINNELDINDIPDAWNEYSKKLLEFIPENHSEGCLQDIHWAWGAIGYFPTYTMGAILSSQIAKAIRSELDFSDFILKGEFKSILSWLREKIHAKASLYQPNELILKAIGEPLNSEVFTQYLSQKYL